MINKRIFSVFFLILAVVFFVLPVYAAEANQFEVFFDRYAATPNMDSTKTLDQIRDFAQTHPKMMILLEGYSNATDVRKGGKNPAEVMDELAHGRALFMAHWLKTALGNEDREETIRSYTGTQKAEAGRRVVVTFYTKDAPPPVLAKQLSPGKAPNILVEESVYQFSGIYEGENVEHDFVVKNTGNDTLEIKSVKPG